MKTFEISVKDKIAVLTNREMYVCGNSDFVVDFSFDAEWDAYDTKTARFAYKGTYQDQVFQGTECPVPIIHDTQIIMVGVFAGNLHTTTAACISARRSILSGSGVPADPAPDVYAQIMELIQGLGDPDPETIAAAVADYIRQNPIEESDPTVPAWAKAQEKPTYTAAEVGAMPDTYTPPNQTAQQVGADPAGTAASAVSQHNTDTTAHNDLRLALQELANRINAALDSDDTTLDQMSEVVAYIKSNKTLIDAITTSKVSVADIVNDLVTNAADKPLSAAQGVVIKTLIDALRNDKLDSAELTNAVNTALAQAKESGEFDGKPGDPGYTPVKGTDYFTEADKQEIAEQAAGLVSIPDKLPNPNALTFTGAVTGSYDGSAPLSVEIPQGGGGSSGGYVDTIISDIEITEEVSTYRTSTLTSDQVEALKNADIIYFCANLAKPSAQTGRGKLLASIYGSYYHATKFFYNDAGYANVTPSSSSYGGDIAESISVKNEASGNYFQTIKWKNTDNQFGLESNSKNRMTITIPNGSVFNISTSTVFGVGTTAKLIARRVL